MQLRNLKNLRQKIIKIVEKEDVWLMLSGSHNNNTLIAFDTIKSKIKELLIDEEVEG